MAIKKNELYSSLWASCDKLHFNDNGDIVMNCHHAYVYNETLATLPENEIIENLAHGVLKIKE